MAAFLEGEIGFLDIARLAESALSLSLEQPRSVEDVFAADTYVRAQTRQQIDRMK